jgi:hypothetical protein
MPSSINSLLPAIKLAPCRNADTRATCLIHPSLRIHSAASLAFYFIAIVALAVAYEYLRLRTAAHERVWRARLALGRKRRNSHSGTPLVAPDREPLR